MNIKTIELSGAALDWAVARLESEASPTGMVSAEILLYRSNATNAWMYKRLSIPYSTDWAKGGPIIEREMITLRPVVRPDGWIARTQKCESVWESKHPLIAAMRCYVASKLGDTVEIPEELK